MEVSRVQPWESVMVTEYAPGKLTMIMEAVSWKFCGPDHVNSAPGGLDPTCRGRASLQASVVPLGERMSISGKGGGGPISREVSLVHPLTSVTVTE